jgi:hypothetical protein
MSDNNYLDLASQIIEDAPNLKFSKEDGTVLDVIEIEMNNGNIVSVLDSDNVRYNIDEITYEKYLLNVPGIGYIAAKSRVIYKEKDYVLLFGWHTNISNQTIYSWYLSSLTEDIPDKTLYEEMINEIEIVHFR